MQAVPTNTMVGKKSGKALLREEGINTLADHSRGMR